MSVGSMIKWGGYLVSVLVFIFGTILFYNDTKNLLSSLSAAILSALLVLISFIMISWLAQVFTKK
ncbi:hypothetical protein PNK_1193 [Candidatus Protochlamydia naegleriophila]|uniref:Uncharacterized protein n=1 Tax=Candidatus Protochlamydia naegleriophila TaxID=389348 RepID=A0A0U5JDD5_9BACT|nr:hypothetical protein [Candidatus Protochlamydia naegleriophila]CUI16810.1 hypothetical protein PNK_1193 [Candidatus Protochlamydia naegleriophila]